MQYCNYFQCSLVLLAALMSARSVAQHAPVAAPVANSATAGTAIERLAKKSVLSARKDGLWEVTLRSEELTLKRPGQSAARNGQTVQQCTSAQAEPVMLLSIVPGQENCRQITSKRRSKGEGHDIRTVCYTHENRAEMQMELMGDLQSAYHGTYNVKYPQTPLRNTGRIVFEGRWLGACSASQRPGDMVLPNGVTVNVVDDLKRAESHGHDGHKH